MKDCHLADFIGYSRHELDRRGARSDDTDTFALKGDRVVPGGGVEDGNLQVLLSRKVRKSRSTQLPDGADQQPRCQLPPIRKRDSPVVCPLVKSGTPNFRSEENMIANAAFVGATLKIGVNFRLNRKHARPVRVRREGERIEMRGDITGRARINIVTPDATDRVRLFQNDEILDAALLQAMRHPDAAKAGSDDDHIKTRAGP